MERVFRVCYPICGVGILVCSRRLRAGFGVTVQAYGVPKISDPRRMHAWAIASFLGEHMWANELFMSWKSNYTNAGRASKIAGRSITQIPSNLWIWMKGNRVDAKNPRLRRFKHQRGGCEAIHLSCPLSSTKCRTTSKSEPS